MEKTLYRILKVIQEIKDSLASMKRRQKERLLLIDTIRSDSGTKKLKKILKTSTDAQEILKRKYDGGTALHIAARYNKDDAIKHLVQEYGMDIYAKNSSGLNLLM